MKAEQIFRGRRILGTIETLPDERVACVMMRRVADIWRGTHPTISAAIQAGDAAWVVDAELALKLRARKLGWFAIRVRDSDDLYIAPISALFDSAAGMGERKRVPLSVFERVPGTIKIK